MDALGEQPSIQMKPGDAPAPHGIIRPRVTAASSILSVLRQDILATKLRPGEALSEKHLTARFGVSRTPVREALMRLAEEGLVNILPQSGTFVSRIPAHSIPESVLIRLTLEAKTVELAARGLPAAALALVERTIARQGAAAALGDQQAFHEADEAFHEALAEAVGYPGLWRVAQAAKTQIDRCRRLTLPVPGRMANVMAEHRVILDAISRRDAVAAATAMTRHIEAVLPDVTMIRAANPDYFI